MTTPGEFRGSRPPNADAIPVVRNIFDFSEEALGELKSWLEANPPAIPVSQIIGFSGFIGRSVDVATSETTTSLAYTDLFTLGPQLSGLAAGSYLVWFGAKMAIGTDFEQARMTIALNGTAIGDAHCAATQSTKLGSLVHAMPVNTGAVANNTLTAKYKSSNAAVTATFENRFLIALKFANP